MDDAAMLYLLTLDLQRTGEIPGDREYLSSLLEAAKASLAGRGSPMTVPQTMPRPSSAQLPGFTESELPARRNRPTCAGFGRTCCWPEGRVTVHDPGFRCADYLCGVLY